MAGFAYDDVPYDTEASADAHPSMVATLGRLCGLEPALPSASRVLEIGCGNGENLIAAATYLPRASFVGFDLAETAIAAGREVARRSAVRNVELFSADLCDVRARGLDAFGASGAGPFDYVIVHGIYSWVPEAVRRDLLALVHDALSPSGLAFVSFNALPGWELRRALREMAMDATRDISEPEAKVRRALELIDEIGGAGSQSSGFFGALSAGAREYSEYVARTTPVESPFARGVFHDLLAECNDAFTVRDFVERLGAAKLRVVCEAPLRVARARIFEGLERDMVIEGTPFAQLIVQRDDAPKAGPPQAAPIADMWLWADLMLVSEGTYKTTTGALVKPAGDDGFARAAKYAPAFVRVGSLVGGDVEVSTFTKQVFDGFCEGVFLPVTEIPACSFLSGERPRVARHVRARAESAVERKVESAVLTNAIHRSFRVPRAELAVLRWLDGHHDVAAIAEKIGPASTDSKRLVTTVIDRFARHLFLCEEPSDAE